MIFHNSALKSLKTFIMGTNPTRTTHNIDEEFHPCPSLVLLPDHMMAKSMDTLPIVEYATLKSASTAAATATATAECWCAVCLGEIEGGHNVRVLGNCDHAFHVECLDSWANHGHLTCPLCRADLVSSPCGLDPWRSQRMVYLFGEDCLMENLA